MESTGEHGAEAFSDLFGDLFGDRPDRTGEPGGEHLGVPSTSSSEKVHGYRSQGPSPPGWSIEVSRIAPASGQSGGGRQVLVRGGRGDVRTETMLLDDDVLVEVER